MFLNRTIKKTFNYFGLDIVKKSKVPQWSFLGLKNIAIKTIIDVGANTGQFAKSILPIFPRAIIYCFEPLPKQFEELNKWVKKQNGRAMAFNIGLSDRKGEKEIFSHVDHSPSSSFLKTTKICENYYPLTKTQEAISVKITTLDNLVSSNSLHLESEILIKIDVQGYENRVIFGGKKTFDLAKACILEVNIENLYEGQANFRDITKLLYEFGFQYAGNLNQTYADDGRVIFIDAVFVKDH
ncbi:MAG: FkbM family methyltransferase [Candidatus Hodarchaeota archaeon]